MLKRLTLSISIAALFFTCYLPTGVQAASYNKYFKGKSEANVYTAPVASKISKVAIMPFKAPTELAGSAVSEILVTEILQMGRYTLVERSQMAQVLGEAELAMAGLSNAQAMEVGAMVGADGVIIGTVDEYGTIAHRGRSYPAVGVSARLIDTKSGTIVWSVSLAKKSDDKRSTLSGHSRTVIHEMMIGLYRELRKQKKIKPKKSSRKRGSRSEPTGELGTPLGFKVSDMGLREVTLTWANPDPGAYRYKIERSLNPDGRFEVIATVSPGRKKYVDSGETRVPLKDATTYYYRIAARDQQGVESEPTRTLESFTAPPPEPPMNIEGEPSGSREIIVRWKPSPSEGIVKYRIQRTLATNPSGFKTLATLPYQKKSYKDGGTSKSKLLDSTDYLYRLISINKVKSIGSPSEPVTVTTMPPPAPVSQINAQSGDVRCVHLAWAPNEELDVDAYTLRRATSPDGPFETLATLRGRKTTQYLDGRRDPGTLPDNQTYYYKIDAHNKVGAVSPDSEIMSATTRAIPPMLTSVTALSGEARQVTLTWDMSEDIKVVGYHIQRAEGDGAYKTINSVKGRETTTYIDKGTKSASRGLGKLTDNTLYRYQVFPYNTAKAKADASPIGEATTRDIPVAPQGLTAEVDISIPQVTLTWAPNPETNIASYEVEYGSKSTGPFRKLEVVAVAEGTQDLFCQDTKIKAGTPRFYRLKAIDQDGLEGLFSEVQQVSLS